MRTKERKRIRRMDIADVKDIVEVIDPLDLLANNTEMETIVNFESTLASNQRLTNKTISSLTVATPFTVYAMNHPTGLESWKFSYEISKTADFAVKQTLEFNANETSKSLTLDATKFGSGYDAVSNYYFRGFFHTTKTDQSIVKTAYTTNSSFSVFVDF